MMETDRQEIEVNFDRWWIEAEKLIEQDKTDIMKILMFELKSCVRQGYIAGYSQGLMDAKEVSNDRIE